MAKVIATYLVCVNGKPVPLTLYSARVAQGARKARTGLIPGGMRAVTPRAGDSHRAQIARLVAKTRE